MCTTFWPSPTTSSTSAYCGTSVVEKLASGSDQPRSSTLPCSMSHAASAAEAPSELTARVLASRR